jgi:hypothetical protein
VLGVTGAALLAFAAFALPAGSRRQLGVGGSLVLLLLAQIAAFPMGPTAGPLHRFVSPTRLLALLPEAARTRSGRAFSLEDLRWGSTFYEGVENAIAAEITLPPARQRALASRLGVLVKVNDVDWTALARAEGLLDALDVEYVVVPFAAAASFPAAHWKDAWARRGTTQIVLRNQQRPGRAWVAYGANVVASEQAALDRLLAPDFDPTREVILEAAPQRRHAAPAEAPPSSPAGVHVPSPSMLEVVAELPRPGLLVVSEAWYPGWRAWVDGAPAPILHADYLLRAVELDAGYHRVRFEYRPRSVTIGAASSLAGVVLALTLAVRDRRAVRRSIP